MPLCTRAKSDIAKNTQIIGPINTTPGVGDIDALILIDELMVVVEAKCQKLPTSSRERANYLNRLQEGASQAVLKAQWARNNTSTICQYAGIASGWKVSRVVPVVISNHSPGVGLIFDGVPVIDLLLLKNYFSRPYLVRGAYAGGKFFEEKGPPIYDDLRGMAERFQDFARKPPPLQVYLDLLKPEYIDLPIREDKPVRMLQFLMNTSLADRILGEHYS